MAEKDWIATVKDFLLEQLSGINNNVLYVEDVGGVKYEFVLEFPDDIPTKTGISGSEIVDINKTLDNTIVNVQRVFPDGEVIIDYSFNAKGKGGDVQALENFNKILKEGKGMKGVLLEYYDTFPVETTLPTTLENDITIPNTPEGIDTPTNVAGAEVIDEIEGIQRETIEKLRNANDAFVAEQVDDIMARKINEVLPFVDTSLSRAEAIGISTTGPQITTSADPVLNTFIDEIEKITGQNLDIKDKRKLRQFLYDVAKGNDNLINDKKSFIPDLKDGVDNSKLKDPGYKIWKNWQHSGAFREKNITGMTLNEITAFGPPDYVYLVEGLEKSGENINFTAISDAGVNIPDTPTNVVDDKLSTFDTTLNSADGNVEFYIKHQGTQVSANDIRYNPNLGSDTEKFIPGFYGEPVGDVSAKTMGIKIQDNPVSNYYKVQVNTNNLLITQPDGFLGNQIDKVDWNIFAKETGISLSDIKNPKTQNVNSLINELKQLGLDDGIIAEGFRKSGIEGFVELKGDWREVVLIDPNDDLGIGSKLNIEDATEVEFLNNQSKVNQIDELVIKPTNVVDDIPPNQTLRVMEESGLSSHSERIRKVAQDYHKIAGLSDPEFKPAMIFSDEIGITSADIFDQLPMYDDTAIPYYNKFIRETNMQYETLIDSGMQFELTDTDPYTPNRAGHAQMINDMENGVLKVLSTESGFGNELTNSANPMLVQSKYTDINGRVMLENDVFRAVHDTFGHGMRGNTFGPVGEYNAWLAHKEMYSSDAKRVMTTETLGQNTYTNYGQHMRDANGNLLSKGDPNYLKPADRPYATQKVALMPQEIIETAGKVVEDVSELVDPKALNKVVEAANANPGVVDNIFKTSKKIVGKMFSTVGAIADPGDIAITQGIARLLPRLGVGVIAAPALAAYVGYELTVLLVDAANAVNKAAQNQNFGYGSQYTPSFMGGKTLQGTEPESVDVNWKKFGQDVWTEFGEVSDTWSLSWKISEPIIDYAFKEYAKYKNNSGNMNTGYIGSFNR